MSLDYFLIASHHSFFWMYVHFGTYQKSLIFLHECFAPFFFEALQIQNLPSLKHLQKEGLLRIFLATAKKLYFRETECSFYK